MITVKVIKMGTADDEDTVAPGEHAGESRSLSHGHNRDWLHELTAPPDSEHRDRKRASDPRIYCQATHSGRLDIPLPEEYICLW